MINYIWGLMIIIGIICSLILGNLNTLNISINNSIKNSVSTIINMIGTICFWSGIMNITLNTELKEKILKILEPIIDLLFPKLKNNKKIKEKIGSNMTLNILGLGNAATPIGMKVVEELENDNDSNFISDEVFLFIIINTVSIQLIPTTIIALRNSYNSSNANSIIFPIIINSLICFCIVVVITKIYLKNRRKKWKI